MKKLTESDEFKDGLEIEGFVVKHPTFGIGTIVDSVYDGDSTRIHIKFEKGKARWLVASAANLTIMSNGTSDEDESDNQKAFDELYGETLEEERDSLLAQNKYLKDRLDSEYELQTILARMNSKGTGKNGYLWQGLWCLSQLFICR